MKRVFNLMSASALALGLAVLPSTLPASAQTADPAAPTAPTDTVPPTTAPADTTTTTTDTVDDTAGDRDFDWGWLGLLGLIGLAGLTRKHDEPVARYREPDEVSSSGNPRY